jgi:phenylpropionate dioxygenase-like ring-hydroxylating dioxygenase large terminal subunit
MKKTRQVEILNELLGHIDNHRTVDAGRILINPTAAYTDPTVAKHEWDTLFQQHPQILGLSGELPTAGSYITSDDFGVPILATRDSTGKFRVFVNACRHRGAQLTTEPRGEKTRFVCPFHGWTYGADGRLLGVREVDQFGHIDKACNGLIELPSAEKYGLLFMHPQRDGVIDVDALLGAELAAELQSWEFERCEYQGESVLDVPLNWKVASDTFGEVYHFNSLHTKTLANLMHGDAATYQEFGRNHRMCVASKYLDVMRQQPESNWSLPYGGIVVYYLFPNVQLVVLTSMVALIRIYPNGQSTARSLTRASHYRAPQIAQHVPQTVPVTAVTGDNLYGADTSARMEFDVSAVMELFVSTLEHEDYFMGAKTQIAANSGKIDHFLFGRNEPALQHFHNTYRDALGMPPLQEYRAN